MSLSDPVQTWLSASIADAERRGLPELKPLLQGLAEATERLRRSDWNDEADDRPSEARPGPIASSGS